MTMKVVIAVASAPPLSEHMHGQRLTVPYKLIVKLRSINAGMVKLWPHLMAVSVKRLHKLFRNIVAGTVKSSRMKMAVNVKLSHEKLFVQHQLRRHITTQTRRLGAEAQVRQRIALRELRSKPMAHV